MGGVAPPAPVHFSFFWLSKERKTEPKRKKISMSATRVRGRIPRTPSIALPVAEKINNFAYERGAIGTYEGFQS